MGIIFLSSKITFAQNFVTDISLFTLQRSKLLRLLVKIFGMQIAGLRALKTKPNKLQSGDAV